MRKRERWWLFLTIGLGLALAACSPAVAGAQPWNIAPSATPVPLYIPTVTPRATATPPPTALLPSPTPSPTPDLAHQPPYIYYTQAGDTLPALAVRFGVATEEIRANTSLPSTGLLSPNTMLLIPRRLAHTTANTHLLPDSEVVYSPSAIDFDVRAYVEQAGGYLSTYREYLQSSGMTAGADILAEVSLNNSINPRLLLALLEYEGHWVYEYPTNPFQEDHPLGYTKTDSHAPLYHQLAWAVNQLSIGYYGWREGLLTTIRFRDGTTARLAPDLNAGTVALAYFFAQVSANRAEWERALDEKSGFPAFYAKMFGDPWARAYTVEPLYPPDLTQPPLILPFQKGSVWYFTGGPHGAWEHDGARAALDFAPGSTHGGCEVSRKWVVAVASGVVVRSGHGVVMLDLDGDGKEQTGWDILYLHIADKGRVAAGTPLHVGDRIGHPSCEGGHATGTHVHIARKYNGEWIAADGPVPFVMDGWVPHAGPQPYEGTLTKDGKTIRACPCGSPKQEIFRPSDDQAP